jgi:hypothetical protein
MGIQYITTPTWVPIQQHLRWINTSDYVLDSIKFASDVIGRILIATATSYKFKDMCKQAQKRKHFFGFQ